jgi:hypothetical protein
MLMATTANDPSAPSTTQNLLGSIEPQTPPSSGTWVANDLATSIFMTKITNGDPDNDLTNLAITVGSSGSFSAFAEDDSGDGFADWDENVCGAGCTGTTTAAIVPDTTANASTGALGVDPTGALGVFTVIATQGSSSGLEAYCIAISVDNATNSATKGRLVCLSGSDYSPMTMIGQE